VSLFHEVSLFHDKLSMYIRMCLQMDTRCSLKYLLLADISEREMLKMCLQPLTHRCSHLSVSFLAIWETPASSCFGRRIMMKGRMAWQLRYCSTYCPRKRFTVTP